MSKMMTNNSFSPFIVCLGVSRIKSHTHAHHAQGYRNRSRNDNCCQLRRALAPISPLFSPHSFSSLILSQSEPRAHFPCVVGCSFYLTRARFCTRTADRRERASNRESCTEKESETRDSQLAGHDRRDIAHLRENRDASGKFQLFNQSYYQSVRASSRQTINKHSYNYNHRRFSLRRASRPCALAGAATGLRKLP